MIHSKLLTKQLESILVLVFKGAIVKIIRIIKEAGRSRVPWVYLVNRYGQRRATFVGVKELNLAFLRYLNQCNRLLLKVDERFALSAAMAKLLKVGDTVFKIGRSEMGLVVSSGQSVFVDWGDGLPLPESPILLELF
ncbi:MAG: hypothetical protein ACRC2R_25430 [Xenococcaceae cyanobacterium]